MKSVRILSLLAFTLALAGCEEEPLQSKDPAVPTPPNQGIQAFIQVDNDAADPGDLVRVFVKVQMGTETEDKLGSYTGRLRFNAKSLTFVEENKVDDGLRVSNPEGASKGDIRFAGAAARGFNDLTIYQGVFEVESRDYMAELELEMEELSAALTLDDLQPHLQVVPQVFLRASGN